MAVALTDIEFGEIGVGEPSPDGRGTAWVEIVGPDKGAVSRWLKAYIDGVAA
jgi:hypothetical protein